MKITESVTVVCCRIEVQGVAVDEALAGGIWTSLTASSGSM